MQAILDWFTSVSSVITSLIEYVVGLVEDMVNMVVMLGTSATEIPRLLSFLPSPIVTLLISFLTAAIIYKIIGREG